METTRSTPLAIIGMACRLPGADDLDAFWRLVVEGRSAVVEAPPERLDASLYYDPRPGQRFKTYTRLGGIIRYPPFNSTRCPVPRQVLPSAEIGHWTICQVAADACRHAGMDPFDLPVRNAGVYVGHNLGGDLGAHLIYGTLVEQTAQYLRESDAFRQVAGSSADQIIAQVVQAVRRHLPRRGPDGIPAPAVHLAAAIISEALGLTGPSMILDAACSSGLMGLAMAARALRLGRMDMAIVGGASFFKVDSLMLFSKARSGSAKASCPFDAEADGLVSAEGYVAIVVKTLDRAIADGDPIWAVVRGIGVSSDGRGKSLWAPRKEGQVEALRRAYAGGLDMARLQYVEAHATSTQAGDVTELQALAEVLGAALPPGRKVPLGGVKANIGHTLEAAGLAGLVKTVLAMRQGVIPRQINLRALNPEIDWQAAPFFVPTENMPWPAFEDGHPRRGAVNSFGIGGLNVHVVLDEYPASRDGAPSASSPGRRARDGVDSKGRGAAKHEPIAIVGAGCVFPGARTLEAFWDLLASGRDATCEAPPDRWDTRVGFAPGRRQPWSSPVKRGGFVTGFEYDWRRHKIPPKQIAQADPLQFMVLDATDAALADAGYPTKPLDKTRMGVVVGTVFGSDFSQQLQMAFRVPDFCHRLGEVLRARGVPDDRMGVIDQEFGDALLQHMPAWLDETGSFTPSTLASRITKTYDFMGPAVTLDAGQASSLAAVYSAIDMLFDGSCDAVICAAGHRAMGLATFEAMSLAGSLAEGEPRSPFDAEARGRLPGEGAGVVVLKRLADARRDGDRVRAVIRGIGAGFAASRRDAVRRAIEQARQSAVMPSVRLALIETAGEGQPAVDAQEIAAVREAMPADGTSTPTLVGSVVAQVGHAQGASGMASLLKATLQLERLEALKTAGAATPIAPLADADSPLRLATSSGPLCVPDPDGRALAGVTSADAWGGAYHAILERGSPLPAGISGKAGLPRQGKATWRIVRLGAASLTDLAETIDAASPAELYARADRAPFRPDDAFRLAIVACGPEDLEKKLELAGRSVRAGSASGLASQGVFVNRVARPGPRVAFLFPGQGSQYAGMLRALVDEFPPAANALHKIDAALDRLQMPAFSDLAWGGSDALGVDVWRTQLSLLCADTIVHQSLEALAVRPDCVAGHSFGEFCALTAAGAWTFAEAARATWFRCRAIEECPGANGLMLSTTAPSDTVDRLCRQAGARAYVANFNAPDQTVAGGEEAAIRGLEQQLKSEGFASRVIAVPRPFHTPLMEGVQGPLGRNLRQIAIRPPRVPLLSSVTNRYVAEPDEIRENLVRQMTSPVRWVDLVRRLADEGADVFVEVGPKQVLTRLAAKILSGGPPTVVASDHPERGGLGQLLAVQACLETIGTLERPTAAPVIDPFAAESGAGAAPGAARSGFVPQAPPAAPVSRPDAASPEAPECPSPEEESPDVIVLSGAAIEMGRQHGRTFVGAIKAMARRYADAVDMQHEDGAGTSCACDGELPCGPFDAEEIDELWGIAEGADVSPAVLAACSLHPERLGVEAIADRVLRVYRPETGLAHVVAALPGDLGAVAGVNERGLAAVLEARPVARTERPDPQGSGPGGAPRESGSPAPPPTLLLRRLLRQAQDLGAAVAVARQASAGSAWEMRLAHGPARRTCRLRFDGDHLEAQDDGPEQAALASEACGCGVILHPADGKIVLRTTGNDGRQAQTTYRLPVRGPEPSPSAPGSPADFSRFVLPAEDYLAANRSVEGRPPFDTGARACSRFVLRMIETQVPPADPKYAAMLGPALIVGRNAVADALRKRIEQEGGRAVTLPLSDDVDKTLAALEKAWAARPLPHLFLLTAVDDDAVAGVQADAWDRRLRRGVMQPYLVCQKWFELLSAGGTMEGASVIAASAMGGDFGLSGRIRAIDGGAMSGLIKALNLEFGWTSKWEFRTKVVDLAHGMTPDEAADAVLREFRTAPPLAEVAWQGGRRFQVGAVHQGPQPAQGCTPTRGAAWIVTGGARGITAEVALALGQRFGVKLHLLGTSPSPRVEPAWRDLGPEGLRQLRAEMMRRAVAGGELPAARWQGVEKALEIDRNLRRMEEAGVQAAYHACDASDRAALGRLLDEIRATDGPIEGIVHGAGVERASRYTKKQRGSVARTIAAKVSGAAALMHLTWPDPLRFCVGFGSVSGRLGSIGQTDYCLASDMLAKLIDWFRAQRPECRSACFHWQPWDGVGMAVRPETRQGGVLRELDLLPPAEGVEHLIAELLAGFPEPEVLITDWDYYKLYHPDLSDEDASKIFVLGRTAGIPARPGKAKEPPPETTPPSRPNQAKGLPCAVASRHVMRMKELPLDATARRNFEFAGPALILGDNADALALRDRLESAGVQVEQLPVCANPEDTLTELHWIWGEKPAPHLFLMTARDRDAGRLDSREDWLARRRRGIVLPYVVCQKWLALVADAGLSHQASLVAATSLGGDFGFAGPVFAPEGGALSGLLKGVWVESGGKNPGTMKVKVIDAPPDEPPQDLAAAMLAELDTQGLDVEVACRRGRRSVVRLVRAPADAIPDGGIRPGGVWVFTGGARGITAVAAIELGRRFGLNLHLLGKSPLPAADCEWLRCSEEQLKGLKRTLVRKAVAEGHSPEEYWGRVRKDREIHANLEALRAAGVRCRYHACDVTDWEALEAALQRIRETDGPIEGIVHGAGVHGTPTAIGDETEESLGKMVEVKADAAVALMLLTRDDPLRHFVGFGSISGRFGTANGSTYTLGSDMLCKLMGWLRHTRPGCRAVGFHWHPWGEVGMMTRPVSLHTVKLAKMTLMPPSEGVQHLVQELIAGAPESEVYVSDSQYHEMLYSPEVLVTQEATPAAGAPEDDPATRPAAGGSRELPPAGAPALISRVVAQEAGRRATAEIDLDPVGDPFLRQHRLRQRPILPLVVGLECLAEAAVLAEGGNRRVAAFRDVRIPDAIRFATDEPRTVRALAETASQGVACRLTSDFRNRRGQLVQKDRLHLTATVELADRVPAIQADRAPPRGDWTQIDYPPEGAVLYHGPPLRQLRRVAVAGDRAWGEIRVAATNELAGEGRPQAWWLPAASLDACLYACGVHVWVETRGGVTVPDSLHWLRLGRFPRAGEKAAVELRCREIGGRHAVYDFTLFGDDGAVVARAEGYRCHVLAPPGA